MAKEFSFTFSDANLASIYSDKDLLIRIDIIMTSKADDVLEFVELIKDVLTNLPCNCVSDVEKQLIIAGLHSSSKVLITFQQNFKLVLLQNVYNKIFETIDFDVRDEFVNQLDNNIELLVKEASILTVCTLTQEKYYSFLMELFLD